MDRAAKAAFRKHCIELIENAPPMQVKEPRQMWWTKRRLEVERLQVEERRLFELMEAACKRADAGEAAGKEDIALLLPQWQAAVSERQAATAAFAKEKQLVRKARTARTRRSR